MARNLIGGRGSGGRLPAGTRMPEQFGITKTTAPTSGHDGRFPSGGRTAPHRETGGRRSTGRYPRSTRSGRYPN
jgi:hypothetical protein